MPRLDRYQGWTLAVLIVACEFSGGRAVGQVPIVDLATIRPQFESHMEARRLQTQPYGQYKMRATDVGPSNYATLDVALSRTIMGENFDTSLTEQQRSEWISHIQSYANPSGTYSDTFGHSQLHANGMTIGALGPLGGKQLYPVGSQYAPFNDPAEVPAYLQNNIDWSNQWSSSHQFWGGLHMYSQSSLATPEWTDAVFDWLDARVDPNTGWWITGDQPSSNTQGLGGGAHIWPIYEHFGHAFPEPERIIDRILGMQVASGRFGGNNSGYMDLDALYGLKYMRTLAPAYRTAEIEEAARDFGTWINGSISGFLGGNPTMHEVLAKVGAFGLLNQLRPDLFPDSTGTQWTDIFTDPKLYLTAEVEVFNNPDLTPVGFDQPSVYSSTVMADAPVGYWRMGQTAGLGAADDSGNDLAGIYNALSTSAGPGNLGQPGLRPENGFPGLASDNRAAHLNGTSSHVSIADRAELDISGAVTMEAWIKLDDYPVGNGGIVSKYVGAGNQRAYEIYVNRQNNGIGALGMIISSDGTFTNARDMVDDVALPLDEWLHVVGTFEPSQFMRLYVNGELVRELTNNIPSQIFSSSADLWLGRQFSASTDFHLPGLIDEAAVYDRALTAAEIMEHYLAATVLSGDYNGDGIVDLADYTVWRDSRGQTGAGLAADGDGSGAIDAGDYGVWRARFGQTNGSGTSASVPEPMSLVMAVVGMLAMYSRRRRFMKLFTYGN
ncbi:MAG: LamG-like jellyroll fold domain-containing protein [Pirellulales bacterium]